MSREVELKLDLSEEVFNAILEGSASAAKPRRQENTYFDTAEGELSLRRFAVRVRIEPELAYITVKGPEKRSFEGVFDRLELEEKIEMNRARKMLDGFELNTLPESLSRPLIEEVGEATLLPRISFINERRRFRHAGLALELDRTEYADGSVGLELEAETDEGNGEELTKSLKTWFHENDWEWKPSVQNKLAKALNATRTGE